MSTQKISHVSASQFKTFSLCQRKWYIEKCTDAPRPEPSAAMLLGSAVHELLEEYVSNGVEIEGDTRAGRIARTAIEHIPTSTDLHVELELRMESIDPPLVGFIDLYDTMDSNCPVVVDYKTTSSWTWAKTEQQLMSDPQMIAYGQYALEQHPAANEVIVAHIQLKTKGAPESRLVSVELTRDHVEAEWSKLVELASKMKEVSRIDDVESVPPTPSACGAFGGCPYADTCAAFGLNKNPFAGIKKLKLESQKKEDTMGRLEELRKRKKNKVALPPAPEANGVLSFDASSRETPIVLDVESEEVVEQPAEAPVESAPTEMTFTEPVPASDKYTDDEYDAAAKALLSHMRERGVQHVSKVAAKALVGKVLDLRRVRLYYVEKACLFSEGTLSYRDGSVYRASSNGKHRATIDHSTGEIFEPEIKPPEPVVEEKKPVSKKEEKATKAPVADAGLTLYIDCLPIKGSVETVLFEELIQPLIDTVAKNNDVTTPLSIPYGEGKNQVAGLLRISSPKGSLLVSSDNPYWAACKTVLIQVASSVVQGIR